MDSYRQGRMAITTHTEEFKFSFYKQSALPCSRASRSSFLSFETWAEQMTLKGPFLFLSEQWGWDRPLGCNMNTLCPTSDFEGLSEVSVSRGRRRRPVLQRHKASSPPLNYSDCPNACRCSSRGLTILRSWLAHQSPLPMTALAWGTRDARCWTHCSGCWSLGNFLPQILYLAIYREQCKPLYWALSWLLSWMPSVWRDEDHPA